MHWTFESSVNICTLQRQMKTSLHFRFLWLCFCSCWLWMFAVDLPVNDMLLLRRSRQCDGSNDIFCDDGLSIWLRTQAKKLHSRFRWSKLRSQFVFFVHCKIGCNNFRWMYDLAYSGTIESMILFWYFASNCLAIWIVNVVMSSKPNTSSHPCRLGCVFQFFRRGGVGILIGGGMHRYHRR